MLIARRLFQFVTRESDRMRGRLFVFAFISGVSNGLLLAVVNHGAEMVANDGVRLLYFLAYAILLMLFVHTKRTTLSESVQMVEEIICNVRMRITDKVRRSELEFVERVDQASIFNRLSQDTMTLSQSATLIFASVEALIMLLFTMIYIAWLTLDGFLITAVAITMGVYVFLRRRHAIVEDIEWAAAYENAFFDVLEHGLKGFKEAKINSARGAALHRHQTELALDVERHKGRAGVGSVTVMIFSQIFFYSLIAVIIFVWPQMMNASIENVLKLTASILFIVGPLELVVGTLPMLLRSEVAIDNLDRLEAAIDQVSPATDDRSGGASTLAEGQIGRLELRGVHYRYLDRNQRSAFHVGPIDLEIRRNEILFIVGGNGSGKSTLLKLISGLYQAQQGGLLVDGRPLDRAGIVALRQRFSILFTDFFLFERLFGLEEIEPAEVRRLIRQMGLEQKTDYVDGRFTTINLSTGQRKRLALIALLLEGRELLVLDEVAADQDPSFRRYYYETLLPDLRDQGKTIIAVTHDDKYFHCADRVIRMEEGRLVDAAI